MASGSTAWQERFATEQDTYRAFLEVVERDGLAAFGPGISRVVH